MDKYMVILLAIGFAGNMSVAELSFDQIKQVPQVTQALSDKYKQLNDSAIELAVAKASVVASLQDANKSYGDKFVDVAIYLNKLTPILELIIGSSKQDVYKEHQQQGILDNINQLLMLMNKQCEGTLSSAALVQIQDALASLESLSKFLTNAAPNFKNLKQ